MWDDHAEHIWVEILVKVTAKSLIVASSVCKAWRSLIRSPFFISAHLSNSENQLLLQRTCLGTNLCMVLSKTGSVCINSLPEFICPFECGNSIVNIVGSCDGLVCIAPFDSELLPLPVVIWNPSIRNHMVLPQQHVNQHMIKNIELGFENIKYGFGVGSNVYKVVKILYHRADESGFVIPPQAEVFSLGSAGSWRALSGLDDVVKVFIHGSCRGPIFFNGFVHWISYEPLSIEDDKHIPRTIRGACDIFRRHTILRFHVGDEIFSELMLPEELKWALPEELKWASRLSFDLFVMGESLGGVRSNTRRDFDTYDVWMMKDYGVKESWTKLYTIDLVIDHYICVVDFLGNGEVMLSIGRHDQLVTYNAETKEIKHVEVFGREGFFFACDYKESLVLLGGYPNH